MLGSPVMALSFARHAERHYRPRGSIETERTLAELNDRADRSSADVESRRAAMAVLAQASVVEIEHGLRAAVEPVDFVELRSAETGLVMLRGRIGGDGAPFNLGEATVTRAAVRIDSGETGIAYVLGRDREKARLSALCDALWQSGRYRAAIDRCVLAPIRLRLEAERSRQRAQTAATRVDFFTLVRGED
jgi:alpha-D-ribose 1-methylphosphonate 5-triphosphate synthase subunit PhnG